MQTVNQAFQQENIYLYSSFLNKFENEPLGKLSGLMTSFTLEKDMSDTEILKKIQNRYSTFADILQLIKDKKQLLNNSYANIFYVEGKNSKVFAVCVGWHSAGREWHVSVWGLDEDGRCRAGRQVLCPGNANTLTLGQLDEVERTGDMPEESNHYFNLVEECHKLIDEIGQRVDILRSHNPTVEEEKSPSISPLDSKLQSVVNHLNELKDSIR